MPEGSSSAAPVMMPGPIDLKRDFILEVALLNIACF